MLAGERATGGGPDDNFAGPLQWSDGKRRRQEALIESIIEGFYAASRKRKEVQAKWDRERRERGAEELRRLEDQRRQEEEQRRLQELVQQSRN